MKQIIFFLLCLLPFIGISQTTPLSVKESIPDTKMKIGMVIYSNDPETVWNAFRFGNFAIGEGDSVKVFLLAKGVECESLNTDKFKVTDQITRFVENGGKIFACGSCLTIRKKEGSEICPLSTMQDMYDIIKWSNKVITF
jgi:sulfur relay (sulfurtransferase) complex TusBCD TusD component (DsrE family)